MMTDIIIASVAVVVFAAVFSLFFFLYASLMRRIARRKHRRVSTLIGVGFCAFIGIAVGGLLLTLEVPTFWEAGFLVVTAGILGMLLLAAGLSVCVAVIVVRPPRRFSGERRSRVPYRLLTAVAWMVMIAAPIIAFATHQGFGAALRIIGPTIGGASLFAYYARRARAKNARDEMGDDQRPPVLYMRPFGGELDLFAELPLSRKQAFLELFEETYKTSKYFQTFEEFMSEAVRDRLGPFVALGNPVDRLRPVGASRIYVPDAEWRNAFAGLAATCSCILSTPNSSCNTDWEFQFVAAAGYRPKLFLMTAPARAPAGKSGGRRHRRALARLFLTRSVEMVWSAPVSRGLILSRT